METIIQEIHNEEQGKIKMVMSFLPAINSPTSSKSLNWQEIKLKIDAQVLIDKVKIYYLETVKSIGISKPFETISIDEFQKKYLGNINEKVIWEQFKIDLHKEVAEHKISKIKYYRIISKLTQKQLAEKLGTQQPNIVRIEKIGYNSDIDTLKKLGEIFKIDYTELL